MQDGDYILTTPSPEETKIRKVGLDHLSLPIYYDEAKSTKATADDQAQIFYSHIRSDRVVEAIARHAHQAPNAKNVQVLLDLVDKLECLLDVFDYPTKNHYWKGSKIKERILNANADKITGTELDPKRRKPSQVRQAPAKPQDDLQRVIQAAREEYGKDVLRAKKRSATHLSESERKHK